MSGIDERLGLFLVDLVALDVLDRLNELGGGRAGGGGVVRVERALLLGQEIIQFVRFAPLDTVTSRGGGDRVAKTRESGLRRSELSRQRGPRLSDGTSSIRAVLTASICPPSATQTLVLSPRTTPKKAGHRTGGLRLCYIQEI